jgi:cytochrome P450
MTLTRDDIPGPSPTPIFGARGNMFCFFSDPVGYMCRLRRRYGEIAAFVKGSRGMVFAFGPAYNQLLLSNPGQFHVTGITVPGPPNSAQRRLGFGLLSMNADQHREHRRMLSPPFHARAIGTYRDSIVSITQELLEEWQTRQRLNLAVEMKKYTLRVASKVLFGIDHEAEAQELGGMMARWLDMNSSLSVRLWLVDRPGTPYRRMLRFAEILEKRLLKLLDRQRVFAAQGQDVLSILIQAHEQEGTTITDAELIGHANILFNAAHETTSNALTWTLFLLSQHPEIASDLLDELTSVLHGTAPTTEQFPKLVLLERVIKESLRILPPAVYNARRTTEAFALGPYEMPAGSTIAFSHYVTHHSPDLFPDPEKFRPERWVAAQPTPYEYLPFSAGPRICLGASFAMMELKIALAMMLQRYRLDLVPGARIDRKVAVTMSPRHGMPVTIHRQDGQFRAGRVRGNIREMVELN